MQVTTSQKLVVGKPEGVSHKSVVPKFYQTYDASHVNFEVNNKSIFPLKLTSADLDYLHALQEPVNAKRIVRSFLEKQFPMKKASTPSLNYASREHSNF